METTTQTNQVPNNNSTTIEMISLDSALNIYTSFSKLVNGIKNKIPEARLNHTEFGLTFLKGESPIISIANTKRYMASSGLPAYLVTIYVEGNIVSASTAFGMNKLTLDTILEEFNNYYTSKVIKSNSTPVES